MPTKYSTRAGGLWATNEHGSTFHPSPSYTTPIPTPQFSTDTNTKIAGVGMCLFPVGLYSAFVALYNLIEGNNKTFPLLTMTLSIALFLLGCFCVCYSLRGDIKEKKEKTVNTNEKKPLLQV